MVYSNNFFNAQISKETYTKMRHRGRLIKLNDLKIGDKATIIKMKAHPSIKKRLLDIGLIRGSEIKKVLENKGMNGYEIKGAVIAIRCEDTKDIEVKL